MYLSTIYEKRREGLAVCISGDGEAVNKDGRRTAEETTFKKLVFRVAATALARSVFPVPGGP